MSFEKEELTLAFYHIKRDRFWGRISFCLVKTHCGTSRKQPSEKSSLGGPLQEVSSTVILLGTFWYYGKLVSEERCSLMRDSILEILLVNPGYSSPPARVNPLASTNLPPLALSFVY